MNEQLNEQISRPTETREYNNAKAGDTWEHVAEGLGLHAKELDSINSIAGRNPIAGANYQAEIAYRGGEIRVYEIRPGKAPETIKNIKLTIIPNPAFPQIKINRGADNMYSIGELQISPYIIEKFVQELQKLMMIVMAECKTGEDLAQLKMECGINSSLKTVGTNIFFQGIDRFRKLGGYMPMEEILRLFGLEGVSEKKTATAKKIFQILDLMLPSGNRTKLPAKPSTLA